MVSLLRLAIFAFVKISIWGKHYCLPTVARILFEKQRLKFKTSQARLILRITLLSRIRPSPVSNQHNAVQLTITVTQ